MLSLCHNPLCAEGVAALAGALPHLMSLKVWTVDLSNVMLCIYHT